MTARELWVGLGIGAALLLLYALSVVAMYWLLRLQWFSPKKAGVLAATFPLWLPVMGFVNLAVGIRNACSRSA